MEYALRPMKIEDIPQIVAIEKKSFPTPWSSYAFTCELCDNEFAYYLVLTLSGNPSTVVGYGGMWIIIDEAHVTNIAVAPAHRGKSLGKMLLNGLLELAKEKRVQRMTLEVRVSNKIAQALYKKMGFTPAGLRPGYYADTNEDALIMWKEI
ncbi:MAG: ribosomal protein S18-alanine N-acetyltransferase [Peptococcaceae bacterium]|jgi:ribosomal-protein-alanine N-acetyltransferase|nr:ribosomal protein S18-alanine N-acetyltransferase [Peptococcaceae bacterium]MDH7526110.1 ribosomal protein S18-alanine N-acetyltransferase [Peptococcaceae bacterium]